MVGMALYAVSQHQISWLTYNITQVGNNVLNLPFTTKVCHIYDISQLLWDQHMHLLFQQIGVQNEDHHLLQIGLEYISTQVMHSTRGISFTAY